MAGPQLISLVLALCAVQGSTVELSVNPSTLHLEDEHLRTRIFHGTNVVYKGLPYVPIIDYFDAQYSFSPRDIEYLGTWGVGYHRLCEQVNAIRLGIMWPGVEPTRGAYNQTYLQLMKDIVGMCERANISVLLDMHQDTWSETFCGEGVPRWAAEVPAGTKGFPEPLESPYLVDNVTGIPVAGDCGKHSWTAYYFTSALGAAVQALYDNHDGLLDSFAAFWKTVATTFKSYNNIIGYELINEPWSGDAVKNPLLMVPGVADRENLQPVYEAAAAAIRMVDPATPVFFESVTWDDILVGFSQSPGGEAFRNKSVYAYHWYAPPNFNPPASIEAHKREAARLQCGWFCTETDSKEFFDAADVHFQSWMRWEYKSFVPITGANPGFWNSNGTLNNEMIFNLTRTYASAIGGVPTLMQYNQSNGDFVLTFQPNSKATTTEIYAYESLHYPKGVKITIEPATAMTWQRDRTSYFMFQPTAGMDLNTPVTIRLSNSA